MKIKCDECKGIGSYDCDSEPGPYGTTINVECPDCDGEGWIEVEDDDDVTNLGEKCDYISPELKEISDTFELFYRDISMSFTGQPTRNYHITYFIERGDVEKEATPLLGGLTLNASSITHAITSFINSTGVAESEIKYIVEL